MISSEMGHEQPRRMSVEYNNDNLVISSSNAVRTVTLIYIFIKQPNNGHGRIKRALYPSSPVHQAPVGDQTLLRCKYEAGTGMVQATS